MLEPIHILNNSGAAFDVVIPAIKVTIYNATKKITPIIAAIRTPFGYELSNFSFFSGLMNRINSYDTSNYMNAVRDGDASVKFMYLIMLQTFLPLFFVIFYCFYYNKFSPYNSLINVFILLALLNPWFSTVQIRYMSVVVFFIKIVTISTFKGDKDVLKKMIWLVRISFLLFLISIYSSRTSLKVGYVSKICTSSFIELVQFHYTDEWINSNINARGDLKKSMK